MFELVSEDRQRKSTVLQIIRKSVPNSLQIVTGSEVITENCFPELGNVAQG